MRARTSLGLDARATSPSRECLVAPLLGADAMEGGCAASDAGGLSPRAGSRARSPSTPTTSPPPPLERPSPSSAGYGYVVGPNAIIHTPGPHDRVQAKRYALSRRWLLVDRGGAVSLLEASKAEMQKEARSP
jgi:hypothetical protein